MTVRTFEGIPHVLVTDGAGHEWIQRASLSYFTPGDCFTLSTGGTCYIILDIADSEFMEAQTHRGDRVFVRTTNFAYPMTETYFRKLENSYKSLRTEADSL